MAIIRATVKEHVMKNCERDVRVFAAIISTVLLLPTQGNSMESDRLAPVTEWRPSPADVRIPREWTAHSSAFSEQQNRMLRLTLDAMTPPEKAFSANRGRLLRLSDSERRLIANRLKEILGAKLVPEEAVPQIGAYERQEGEKTVRRFQLSYQRGALRVAISGKLDEFIPKDVTVLLAKSDHAPRAYDYVSAAPVVEEYPSTEIVEVESGVERRFKTTLLHYE